MIIPSPSLLTSVALTIEQGCPVSFGLEAAGGDNCIFPCSTQAIPPSFNARVTSPSRDGVDTGRGKVRARCLWRELRAAGFPGTARQVHRSLAERRTAPARTTPREWLDRPPTGPTPAGPGRPAALPSPARLARLLVQPPA